MQDARDNPQGNPHDPHRDERPAPSPTAEVWTDAQGRDWEAVFAPDAITLTRDETQLAIPADRWQRDILVTPFGPDSFVVRFSTFDHEVGFILKGEAFAPLADVLQGQIQHRSAEKSASTDTPSDRLDLNWPKVSRAAVWAVIFASLAFLPGLGVLAAAVALALLVHHKRHVRNSAAWRHSRSLCAIAAALLITGLPISGIATAYLVDNLAYLRQLNDGEIESTIAAQEDEPAASPVQDDSGEESRDWGLLVAGLFVLLFSLTIHEGAHAISAWWLGDDSARRLGRVTLNPLSHIDPFGSVILPLILFWANLGVFGWARPVPTDTTNCDRPRRAQILIALAGPGSNLLVAAASLSMYLAIAYLLAWFVPDARLPAFGAFVFDQAARVDGFVLAPVVTAVLKILNLSFIINLVLAIFNLIPVPPLDGSWVLEHLFPRTLGPIYERVRPYGFLLFLALIYSDALYWLLAPAFLLMSATGLFVNFCTPW